MEYNSVMELEQATCPVCDGTGKLFIQQYLGDLRTYRQVECSCWCCKGNGYVRHDIPKDHKSGSTGG